LGRRIRRQRSIGRPAQGPRPDKEHAPRDIRQAIHDALLLDGNARQNLTAFCQTWVDPEIRRIMAEGPAHKKMYDLCKHK
jgi:glutamate/tyrosine decarboxylase-like PLP-dependent enzyme